MWKTNIKTKTTGSSPMRKAAAVLCASLMIGLLPGGGLSMPAEVYAQGRAATPSEPEGEKPELKPSKPEEAPETENPKEEASSDETEIPEEEMPGANLSETEATPSEPEEETPELEPEFVPDTAELPELPLFARSGDHLEHRGDDYFSFGAGDIRVQRTDKTGGMYDNPFLIKMHHTGESTIIPAYDLLKITYIGDGPGRSYLALYELDIPDFYIESTNYLGNLSVEGETDEVSIVSDRFEENPAKFKGTLHVKFSPNFGMLPIEGELFEEDFPIEIWIDWFENYQTNRDGTHTRTDPNGKTELPCEYKDNWDIKCIYCGYYRLYFAKQPKDVSVNIGDPAEFSVKAMGYMGIKPTYQWQFSEWGDEWTDIEGANEPKYTIPAVTEEMDATYYRCKVVNGKDIAISNPAELIISDDAGSVRPPENNGDECFSNFDGTHFYDDGTGTGTPEDCVYDAEGVCTLCGYHRLIITEEPQDVTAKPGTKAAFSVKIKGDGASKAICQWQFSSDGGTTWQDDAAEGSKQPTYQIASVAETMNSYLYRCQIANGRDIVYSRACLLTVEDESNPIPPENKPDDNDSSSDSSRPSSSSGNSDSSDSSRSNVTVTIYERPNGKWLQDADGAWSFAKPDGTQVKNEWYECVWNGVKSWYFFDADGKSQKGWLADSTGNTYFLHDKNDGGFGAMYTGWHWINGKCYYFNTISGQNGLPYGALLKSGTTPDGYTVNEQGQWTVDKQVVIQ